MKDLISVEGHSNLFRDDKTGAIINCDAVAYEQYLNTVRNRVNLKTQVKNLQDEVSEIKSLLKELINESRKN